MRYAGLILLGLMSISSHGQTRLELSGMYSSYQMSSVRQFMNDFNEQVPVELKAVTDFPNYVGYKLSILNEINESLEVGLAISLNSTGARMHYSDYSGSIQLDNIIHVISIGIRGGYVVEITDKFELNLIGEAGVDFTNMTLAIADEIGGSTNYESFEFGAEGIYLWPSVRLNFAPTTWLNLFFEPGIAISILSGSIKLGDGTITNRGSAVVANWTGLRISGGLGFVIVK